MKHPIHTSDCYDFKLLILLPLQNIWIRYVINGFWLNMCIIIECFVSLTLELRNFQNYIIHLQITFNQNLAAHSTPTHR